MPRQSRTLDSAAAAADVAIASGSVTANVGRRRNSVTVATPFASPTTYSTTNATRDLADTEVSCPSFDEYAYRLIDFMREHAEISSKAMV